MKKLISLFMVLAMLAVMIPVTVVSADAPLSYEGYTVVNSKAELKALNGKGGNFVLGSDIDMEGEVISGTWITIKGVLDGNGHSITNFSLKATGNNTGLFLQGGDLTIRNLTIGSADALIDVTQADGNTDLIWVGTVVRFVQYGALNFENVHVYSNIHDLTASYVGGFTACNRDVADKAITFTNCTMNGNINCALQAHDNNTNVGVGGFLGVVTTGNVNFTQCINNADITRTDEVGNATSAGYIGFVQTSGTLSVVNCINNGAISGRQLSGGLFGYLHSGATTVNGYWNNGNITVKTLFAGSVFGRKNADLTLKNALNTGNILTSDNFAGSIGGHNSGGKLDVTNFATYGNAKYGTCEGTAPNPITNAFYCGNYTGKKDGMTELPSKEAIIEKVNSEGFLSDFRKIYGDFTTELTPVTSFAKTTVAGWQDKTNTDSSDMRFVGYVDCLGYDAVGFRFEITYNGRTETFDSGNITTAFQTITGGGETYTAQSTEYRNGYLYAYIIEGVPTGVTYKVTPYCVSAGTTVYGQTVTVER